MGFLDKEEKENNPKTPKSLTAKERKMVELNPNIKTEGVKDLNTKESFYQKTTSNVEGSEPLKNNKEIRQAHLRSNIFHDNV